MKPAPTRINHRRGKVPCAAVWCDHNGAVRFSELVRKLEKNGFRLVSVRSSHDRSDLPIEIPITDVFDLHSVPDADVRPVVEAYLEEALARDYHYVRIIHGRGIGVRREIVRAVLARSGFVESFADAPSEAGGWGATVATLRVR